MNRISTSSSSNLSNLKNELIRLIESYGSEGISDKQIQDHFGSRYLECCPALNELLQSHRLKLLESFGAPKYGIYTEEIAVKLETLG